MASNHHHELRNQIIKALNDLSHDAGSVYMGMAETYPVLINEMKRGLQESESLIGGQGASRLGDTTLLDAIAATTEFVRQANQEFLQSHQSDRGMHQALGDQVSAVGTLNALIDRIREDSSAMELISLNAMTVAFKAGNQGRAFSFITEELKRLSSKTIDLTRHVTSQGGALVNFFAEFQDILEKLDRQEEAIFGDFMARANEIFEDFSGSVAAVNQGMLELNRKSAQVQAPLVAIMTEIQNHDLIRQSIEHVVLSLQEIRSLDSAAGVEQNLDELAFLEILPQLCSNVLDEVADQIRGNRDVFRKSLGEAQRIIEQLEHERLQFVQVNADPANPKGIEHKFGKTQAMFANLIRDIEALYRAKENTVNISKELQKQVKQLDDSFKSFESLITRFKTIDVASRIEIAKQSVLAMMGGTVDEMTALTLKIDEDVERSTALTAAFLEGTQRILNNYRQSFIALNRTIHQFIDRVGLRTRKLNQTKDILIQSIRDCQIFTATFSRNFTATAQDLGRLDALLGRLDELKFSLDEIKTQLGLEKAQYMQANGITTWNLENSKLRAMIERFTIFNHKKFAGDLGGFQVEQGTQSGEITLF